MNEPAALLVEQVLPRAPVRQWVITFPIEVRYRLAYDPWKSPKGDDERLCSAVLGRFLRAVSSWYRRKARQVGYAGGRTGSVTVIQRASGDLRVNPHFHAIVLDGVFVEDDDGGPPVFVETPRPADDEIKKLVETVASRVIRHLVQRGVLDENFCATCSGPRSPTTGCVGSMTTSCFSR